MEALQNRINSFAKQKRVKNPSKSSSYVNAKWPHSSRFLARPETLAEAGFYYNPSFEDRDNVSCFVCGKQLSEWEEGDDPFGIHWEKCGTKCCWASVRCGLKDDMDEHNRFFFTDKTRLPTSKQMERVRLETFAAGDGWIHDQDKNHGAASQKMARAGFVYTAQHPGDDLATCLYCNISLSGWDAEDDPMEEHRKREKKSGYSCPFFSTTTINTAEGSKPHSRTHSKPNSQQSQQLKSSRSTSTKPHVEVFLPTKTHDGDLNSDESDTNNIRPRKSRSTPSSRRPDSSAKTHRKHTRSQSRGASGLDDVAEDEEDVEEEGPMTRRSRRPTTVAASVAMATPGKPGKLRSRSKSVSRAKAKTIEEEGVQDEGEGEGEEPEAIIHTKTPSTKAKTKMVKDEEEEVMELKKSTRGRPKAKTKPKPNVVLEPEVNDEEEIEEVEQTKPKPKAKPSVGRKPSRSKSKPAPVLSPLESEDDREEEAPAPITLKKSGTVTAAALSTASAGPESAPRTSTPPSQTITKVKGREAEPKVEETVEPETETAELDELDAFVSAPSSSHPRPVMKDKQKEPELAPLYVPKRGGKPKGKEKDGGDVVGKNVSGRAESNLREVEEDSRQEQVKGPALIKGQGKPSEQVVQVERKPSSQVQVPAQEKRKGKGKEKGRKGEDKEMKGSIMKVVEISTDEEGDNGPDDGNNDGDDDGMDVDVDLNLRKEKGKEKENILNIQHEAKVIDTPVPAMSNPTSSEPVIKGKNQVFGEIVQPAKAKAVEKALPVPPAPAPPPTAEDDVDMAEVETELGSGSRRGPDEHPQYPPEPRLEDPAEGLPQTPPKRNIAPPQPILQFLPQPSLPPPSHPTLTFPALSKLPFTPLESLTDAELDMTVEEWVRYQMGVEFDKFRRDGERELQRWVKRADEARTVIEAL